MAGSVSSLRYPWAIAILLALPAAGYGALVALLALGLSGGGHGWNSAWASSIAVLLVPLYTTSWVYRRHVGGTLLCLVVLLVAIVVDVLLVIGAQNEAPYVRQVWSVVPWLLVIWLLLWSSWQIAALVQLLNHRRWGGQPPKKASLQRPRGAA